MRQTIREMNCQCKLLKAQSCRTLLCMENFLFEPFKSSVTATLTQSLTRYFAQQLRISVNSPIHKITEPSRTLQVANDQELKCIASHVQYWFTPNLATQLSAHKPLSLYLCFCSPDCVKQHLLTSLVPLRRIKNMLSQELNILSCGFQSNSPLICTQLENIRHFFPQNLLPTSYEKWILFHAFRTVIDNRTVFQPAIRVSRIPDLSLSLHTSCSLPACVTYQ